MSKSRQKNEGDEAERKAHGEVIELTALLSNAELAMLAKKKIESYVELAKVYRQHLGDRLNSNLDLGYEYIDLDSDYDYREAA